MKKLNYLLSLAVLVIIFASSGCGGGDDPDVPADDQVGEKLTSVWRIDGNTANSVTYGGTSSQDRTSDYSDFTLTITYDPATKSGTYLISGGPEGDRPFPSSKDTWSFSSVIADPSQAIFPITRDVDKVQINVELTENSLQLSFNLPETGITSRTEAVYGDWFFSFVK